MRTYHPNYLERETYNRVISVARSYYQDLNKIKQIENDYIFMTSRPDGAGGRTNYISDPTYNITNQIEKHTRLLRQRTESVKKALSKFTDYEKDILIQNVIEGIPIIYCNTQKSERSIQRLRHEFLITLAAELGETI